MSNTQTPAPAASSEVSKALIVVGGTGLIFLGLVLYTNAAAVRAMRRTTEDLDAIMARILENATRPAGGPTIPPSPPAGRVAEQPATAKAEGGDTPSES